MIKVCKLMVNNLKQLLSKKIIHKINRKLWLMIITSTYLIVFNLKIQKIILKGLSLVQKFIVTLLLNCLMKYFNFSLGRDNWKYTIQKNIKILCQK